ncbi:unnamed protein product [Miscanthus lutarioriparius]|uniref:Uncharacterized protein n=1 Tax=Miscanthus lutarioriparius TaxID=422564 RepID=A0A811PCJ7_9POAL|nr:unnamed protein product [Miscanthus lutarioriparius]
MARVGIVLCSLLVLIVGAALAATAAEARVVPPGYAAPDSYDVAGTEARAGAGGTGGGRRGGIRRGRWNVQSVQGDGARKREVPGGPDPQHHG